MSGIDYGRGVTNRDADTGIRYGYISANALDSALVSTLLYGEGGVEDFVNHSYDSAEEEARKVFLDEAWNEAEARGEPFDDDDARGDFEAEWSYEGSEDHVSGTYEGVAYASSWLGGALNFFVFKSPHVTRAAFCSPCVPGAGDLDTLDPEGVETYDVPPDWRREEV